MSIFTVCYHCEKKFPIQESQLGQLIRCPACNGLFTAAAASKDSPGESPRAPQAAVLSVLPVEAVPSRQILLRTIVLLCGLLGAAASGALGFLWWTAHAEMSDQIALARLFAEAADPALRTSLKDVDNQGKAYPLLFVAGFLGVIGGLLGFLRRGLLGGFLMLFGVVGPTFYFPKSLIFTAILLAGGLLCFLIKSPKRALAAAQKALQTGREPSVLAPVLGTIAAIVFGLMLLGYSAFLGFALYSAGKQQDELLRAGRKEVPNRSKEQAVFQLLESASRQKKTSKAPEPATVAIKKDSVQEIPIDSILDEIQSTGGNVKLVKLDLSPAGLDATLNVPEGCQLKENYGEIMIVKDAHFSLKVRLGRASFASEKADLRFQKAVVNSSDLVLSETGAQKPSYKFGFLKVLGYQDVSVENHTWFDDKQILHDRADCLLMIKCARTLARKTSLPADRAVALRYFRSEEGPKEPKPGEIILGSKATDATLALVENDPGIRVLDLHQTKVTSDGFSHLQGLTNLEVLNANGRSATDSALRHLSGLTALRELRLEGNSFSDDGLRALSGLVNLEVLDIGRDWSSNNIKGPGLAYLAGLKKLKSLELTGLEVDDSALAHLKSLTGLNSLNLERTQLLGPGLAHLKELPSLKRLDLNYGKINDAGLEGLQGLTNLEELSLHQTQVTGEGLKHLKELRKLKSLDLAGTKLTNLGLEQISTLASLETLDLHGTLVTDDGLGHLKSLKDLKKLSLAQTQVTDAGIKQLDGLDNLDELELWGTKVKVAQRPKKLKPPVALSKLKPAEPVAMIQRLGGKFEPNAAEGKAITAVTFNNAKIKDLDLADLRDLKSLRVLNLGYGGEVTDAGLYYLKGLTDLEELDLGGARIRGEGLAILAGLTKLRKLQLPYTDFSPEQLAPLKALVNLEEFTCNLATNMQAKLKIMASMSKLRNLALPGIQMTDDCLAQVGQMTGLENLVIPSSPEWRLTDSALVHLKNLSRLKTLSIAGAAVTGDGFQHLDGFADLETFDLSNTLCADPALQHLRGLTKLQTLDLSQNNISDAGLEHLKGLTSLSTLNLSRTRVTGSGFEQLKGLIKLQHLDLSDTPFTDRGMKNLRGLAGISSLSLQQTEVTDAGLENLKGMNVLESLLLGKTKVTGAGFAGVGALPGLVYLELADTQLDDAGLEQVAHITSLKTLTLTRTRISDAGLPHLNRLVNLETLALNGTAVNGAGLKEVSALKKLVSIDLSKTKLAEANLDNVSNFTNLSYLQMTDTWVTDAGLARLKGLLNLQSLNLDGTLVSDAGLAHVAGLAKLQSINALGTKVTRAGEKKLKQARPDLVLAVGSRPGGE